MAQAPITQPTPKSDAPKPPDAKQQREQAAKDKAEAAKKLDEMLLKRATEGVPEELKDKVLALGGDITRGSPALEQQLPDPVGGLTTTTGAYRVPLDPTTAAVPLKEEEVDKQAPKGYPAVKDKKSGDKNEKAA